MIFNNPFSKCGAPLSAGPWAIAHFAHRVSRHMSHLSLCTTNDKERGEGEVSLLRSVTVSNADARGDVVEGRCRRDRGKEGG